MSELKDLQHRMIIVQMLRGIHIKNEFQGSPICKGQHPILYYILNHEGCSQKNIADSLMVTPASIALSLKRMAKAGLIRKDSHEQNLRCNRIYLTELGREVTQNAEKTLCELDKKQFEGFSREDMLQFDRYLGRMINNLRINDQNLDIYSLNACLHSEADAEKGEELNCND